MNNEVDFAAWLKALTGDDTQKVIAKKAGLIESTLSRQLSRGTFRPEMVIALCRAYNRSPVTGLIETGYLHDYETEGVAIPYALQEATNQQILDEIMRRSDPEARELFGDPTGAAIDYEPIDDLAQRRHTTPETRELFTPAEDDDGSDLDGDAAVFDFATKAKKNVPPDPYADGAMPPDAVADSSEEVGGTLDDYDM